MLDAQRFGDSMKMLFGSFISFSGGMWAWIGENNQSIGAACAMLGALYASFYFFAWLRKAK